MTTVPGTNKKAHLHPFFSLRLLHEALGDSETSVPLSNVTNSYTVTPKAFVDAEYPVDPTEPTTEIVNGTKTITEDHEELSVDVTVIYSILLAVFLILAILFARQLCKANDSATRPPISPG